MTNYYEVIAKCGHVGRKFYYEGHFFVKAEDGSEAAQNVRLCPRVKHNHKDAIISVSKISHEQFNAGLCSEKDNPYFKCKNVQQQRQQWKFIQPWVFPESNNEQKPRKTTVSDNQKTYRKNKRIRNHYRYNRINTMNAKIAFDLNEG